MDYLNFATRAANRHERSSQWRAVTHAPNAELGDDREAAIRGCDLGELRLCDVALGTHRMEDDHRGDALDSEGPIKLLFQQEGDCAIEQGGTRILLAAGQWCTIDKTQPFCIESAGASRQLALSLPRRRIADWRGEPRGVLTPQGFLRGAGHVLHASAAAAVDSAVLLGRRDRARLGEVLIGLINFAWHADPAIESAATKRGRRMAVLDYIERNLSDPGLDVSAVARALGYSKRTLHKLFANDSASISRIIWQRRLEHCRMALLDPASARQSITEVAHHWGFGDSQHFSRAFKARFGASPRSFRNAHLAH